MRAILLLLLLQGGAIKQADYGAYFYSVSNVVSPIYVISKPGEPYEVIGRFNDTSTANFMVMIRELCNHYPDMQGLIFTTKDLRQGEVIRFK